MEHWRAAGNKLKTARYLTESGAAALATSSNMQALSYLYDVQKLFQEESYGDEIMVSDEEKARVDSLIGQVLQLALLVRFGNEDHTFAEPTLFFRFRDYST